MNFHNFKTHPVKGKSLVFKPYHSSQEGAKEYVRYVVKESVFGKFGAVLKTMFVHTFFRGF